MLASSFIIHLQDAHAAFENYTISINPPSPAVAQLPIVGDKVCKIWTQTAQDFRTLLEKLRPQLGTVSKALFEIVAGSAGGLLMFPGSMIIAGVMMAYADPGSTAMLRITCRLAGPREGPQLHSLSYSAAVPMRRCADAPMPIILIGTLGGMVTGGMIGLFLGAELLTLGYMLFMEWVSENQTESDPEVEALVESTPQPEQPAD